MEKLNTLLKDLLDEQARIINAMDTKPVIEKVRYFVYEQFNTIVNLGTGSTYVEIAINDDFILRENPQAATHATIFICRLEEIVESILAEMKYGENKIRIGNNVVTIYA